MKAVILAGGYGTRIKGAIPDHLPKPMAPVNGKPFLEYLILHLSQNDISEIVISVGYKYEQIQKYFGSKYKDIDIKYSIEMQPLGTGGAVRLALLSFSNKDEEVFVLNGDTYFPINMLELLKFHQNHQAEITLSLKHVNDLSRYGSINLNEDNRIMAISEKTHTGPGVINAGTYIMGKEIFRMGSQAENFSLEAFIKTELKNNKVFGKIIDRYFIDIGVPGDYLAFQEYIKREV